MPRQARKQSATGIYHIMVRGINRQRIFEDHEDCETFVSTLLRSKEKTGFALYGYCLMGNHIHLLVQDKKSVALAMQSICSTYVYWYNGKYDRIGHLFQERYKSEAVETDAYLLTVLRYIHQNPVKAGLANGVEGYPWSSYHEYTGQKSVVDTDFILGLFATDEAAAKTQFVTYMNEMNQDLCLDYKEKHRLTDEEIIKLIREKYKVEQGMFHLVDIKELDVILKNLKSMNGITIRQLVRVTGISKFIVEKA